MLGSEERYDIFQAGIENRSIRAARIERAGRFRKERQRNSCREYVLVRYGGYRGHLRGGTFSGDNDA